MTFRDVCLQPKDLGLPKKFNSWRSGQLETIGLIAQSEKQVYLLDAPTGIGKSVIGIGAYGRLQYMKDTDNVLARMLGEEESHIKCVFVTRTKQLQEQVIREFPFARTITGRSNFPCSQAPDKFPSVTAEDCTDSEDRPCEHACEYKIAKARATAASVAVLNTAYFLTEANGPGYFSRHDRNFIVVDEVDSLESDLMNYIKLEITEKQLQKFGLDLPSDTKTVGGWIGWANFMGMAMPHLEELESKLADASPAFWTDIEINQNKRLKKMKSLQAKLNMFVKLVNDGWIFREEVTEDGRRWTFQPVEVGSYAEEYFWRHGYKFLGMSGSILDPAVVGGDIGITSYDYNRMVCPFPVTNRPIYYKPRVNLNWKTMREELPKLADAVLTILNQHPNDKILVHAISHEIRNYLVNQLIMTGRIITHDSQNRADKLDEFKNSREPLVMISPSFERGVDLPDDKCRVIIICKVPYLSKGDPQVEARMKLPNGQRWYLLRAAQAIVQMTGRGVRSNTDHCETYILDAQFSSLMLRIGYLIPAWWKTAVISERG